MKKITVLFLCTILWEVNASALSKMGVFQKNNNNTTYNIAEINKITFNKSNLQIWYKNTEGSTFTDLGTI
jgi:hypothetical protein